MVGGGPAATLDELRRFHDALFCAYEEEMGGNAVARMKEWWAYAKFAFANPIAVQRTLRKVRKVDEYQLAVRRVFDEQGLAEVARYRSV